MVVYANELSPSDSNAAKLGRTNYGGVAGLLGRGTNSSLPGLIDSGGIAKYEGYFSNRSRKRLSEGSDGSSNTLMIAEASGGSDNGRVSVEYGASWMGFGCFPTFGGMANHNSGRWFNLSSGHTGVVVFGWGDGSVRSLRIGGTQKRELLEALVNTPPDETGGVQSQDDYWVYQQLAGFNDRGIRPNSLGN